MNGLTVARLKEQTFSDRLLRRQPKENGVIEVHNLFACAPLYQINPNDVERILGKYKLQASEVKESFAAIYAGIMRYFALDEKITADEREQLERVQGLLDLDAATVKDATQRIIEPIYRRHVKEAIKDGVVTDEEQRALESLRRNLGLSEQTATQIYAAPVTDLLQRTIEQYISDRKLSDEESTDLQRLAVNLNAEISSRTWRELDRFRLLWRISQGDIPQVPVEIYLQKNEACAFTVSAQRYEQRTRTVRTSYSGVSTSFRICKGVYWRAGTRASQSHKVTEWTPLGAGEIYITNRRILFNAQTAVSIPYKKIISFACYEDGLLLSKETGKDQMFEFRSDPEILNAMLQHYMTEARK